MGIPNFHFKHLYNKLVVTYWFLFLIVIALSLGSLYFTVRKYIVSYIDSSLKTQLALIRKGIESSTDTAIKSYYRAKLDTALNFTESAYQKYISGELSEEAAKEAVFRYLSQMRISTAGYITVLDRKGEVVFHPDRNYLGENISEYSFVENIMNSKDSFQNYLWPPEASMEQQEKLLFSKYFAPWHWYISATGYTSELQNLVSLEDFEEKILSIQFGESGYPIVINKEGTLLIHPNYKGVNMYDRTDAMGEVVRTSLREKNGRMEYFWKNPEDRFYRKKITLYSEIPTLDVLVAVTAYKSEFFKPLNQILIVFIVSLVLSLFTVILFTRKISHSITKPILDIKNKMDKAATGDLSVRTEVMMEDEVGIIGSHFNQLLEELSSTRHKLINEERYSNMGRLIARISHHLSTPVGNISMLISSMSNKIESEEFDVSQMKDYTVLLEHSLDDITQILESFKLLQIQAKDLNKMKINLYRLVSQLVSSMGQDELLQRIHVEICGSEDFTILSDYYLLTYIFKTLLDNSIIHSFSDGRSGRINIEIRPQNYGVEILYRDNGMGIPSLLKDHIFEPFFSSSREFQSKGTRLNIVYNLITECLNGEILYTGDTNGVSYVLKLPSAIS